MIDSMLEVKPIAHSQSGEDKMLYTTGEVAARTGLSQQTIIRCFDSGRIGGFRVPGSTSRRITHKALMAFMHSHGIPVMGESDESEHTCSVLLIHDDQETISSITQAMESRDCIGLHVATTAWEAGLLAASARPDLVIISARMPDLNLEQVCRSLRDRPELQSMHLVALARRYRQGEKETLRQLGVETFLRPPLEMDEILGLIPAEIKG
jgi:excisionase family DNA binding protein